MRRLCIAACLTAALTMPTVPAQAFYRKDCWAGAPCPRYAPPGYYDDDNDVVVYPQPVYPPPAYYPPPVYYAPVDPGPAIIGGIIGGVIGGALSHR